MTHKFPQFTKTQLAQRIQTELFAFDKMLPIDDEAVIRRARQPREQLEHQYQLAVDAANSVNRTVIFE